MKITISSVLSLLGVGVLITLALNGSVAANLNQWAWPDTQEHVIEWGKMNAEENAARLYSESATFGIPAIPLKLYTLTPADLQKLLGRQRYPEIPGSHAISPVPPSGSMTTIDGTPISGLFSKAMENYRINPPKTIIIPGANEIIYSRGIIFRE